MDMLGHPVFQIQSLLFLYIPISNYRSFDFSTLSAKLWEKVYINPLPPTYQWWITSPLQNQTFIPLVLQPDFAKVVRFII